MGEGGGEIYYSSSPPPFLSLSLYNLFFKLFLLLFTGHRKTNFHPSPTSTPTNQPTKKNLREIGKNQREANFGGGGVGRGGWFVGV